MKRLLFGWKTVTVVTAVFFAVQTRPAQTEPHQVRPYQDKCLSACSNLRVMFQCAEGGDYRNGFEPCISDCRSGKVSWNIECARKARTFDDVKACGIRCVHAGTP